MPSAPHVLVICHTFPPYRGIGGRRWAKFAKGLAQKGYMVHVVCSNGSDDLKGSLWTADRNTPGIVVHELPQRYPTALFKRPLRTFVEKALYRFWMRAMPLIVKGNWFDRAILWEEQLIRICTGIVKEHRIRNVIVSGAPFSLMTHALRLKERFPDIHLIADFRDPWTWVGGYGFPSLSKERQQRELALEAEAVRSFDLVISPHPAIIDHLRSRYGGDPSKYHIVPHPLDPDEFPTHVAPRGDGSFRMIFAGNVYDPVAADGFFRSLFDGLARLRTVRPDLFGRTVLEILITDGDPTAPKQLALDRGLSEQVRFIDPLPPREFFQRVAMADLALVFSTAFNKDHMVTKFNELFHLRKPVLHVGEAGVVSRTIVEKRLGASIRLDELPVELPKFISGERTIDLDPTADTSADRLDVVTDQLLGLMV